MKLLPLIAALALTGCATTVRAPNGVVILHTSSNFSRLHFRQGDTSLTIEQHDPAKTIRAGGSVVGTASTGLTAALMAWFSGVAVK